MIGDLGTGRYQTSSNWRVNVMKSRSVDSRMGRPVIWGCITTVTEPPHDLSSRNSSVQIDNTCCFDWMTR